MQADSLTVVLTFENQQFYGNHDFIFCHPAGTNTGLFSRQGPHGSCQSYSIHSN
jgi:hypothetical protein